jgi:hypothetical protein
MTVNVDPRTLITARVIFCMGCFMVLTPLLDTTAPLFPNVPDRINAISPIWPAETAAGKADLARLLGPPGSPVRREIGAWRHGPPRDGLFTCLVFMLLLAGLMYFIRPKLRKVAVLLFALAIASLAAHEHIQKTIMAAVHTEMVTDAIALEIHRYAVLEFTLLFVNALLGSLLFLGSGPQGKSAGYLFIAAATLGIYATALSPPLLPYAVLGILFALLGGTVICALMPDGV